MPVVVPIEPDIWQNYVFPGREARIFADGKRVLAKITANRNNC